MQWLSSGPRSSSRSKNWCKFHPHHSVVFPGLWHLKPHASYNGGTAYTSCYGHVISLTWHLSKFWQLRMYRLRVYGCNCNLLKVCLNWLNLQGSFTPDPTAPAAARAVCDSRLSCWYVGGTMQVLHIHGVCSVQRRLKATNSSGQILSIPLHLPVTVQRPQPGQFSCSSSYLSSRYFHRLQDDVINSCLCR